MERHSKPVRFAVEQLEDRSLLNSSPLTLAANHELLDGSTLVLNNVEQYQWCSATNTGFALQQGGDLYVISASSPTEPTLIDGDSEGFCLSSVGTLDDLSASQGLQLYNPNTGNLPIWWRLDPNTVSIAITSNNMLYDLDAGGNFNRRRAATVLFQS
jgi:hypothetical protein